MPLKNLKMLVGITVIFFSSTALGGGIPLPLNQLVHTRALKAKDYDGQNVHVGIISNGASNLPVLQKDNILPNSVQIFGDSNAQGDEGDWMMQIVHSIAPDARLGFCAGGAPQKTVACARALISKFHANIIVDDINPQPVFFSPTLKTIGYYKLHKKFPKVLFFTGAGNNNGGYYESSWKPGQLFVDGKKYLAQQFGEPGGANGLPYDQFVLPPHASAVIMLGTNAIPSFQDRCRSTNPLTHLDLLNVDNHILAAESSKCSILQLSFKNDRDIPRVFRIAILLNRKPKIKKFALKLVTIFQDNGVSPLDLQFHNAGGAGNSATAPSLVAVASVDPNSEYNNKYIAEKFSNRGPQLMWYETDSNSATGWVRLPQAERFHQPLLAAPDRTIVAFPASNAAGYVMRPFLGDSAAAPVVAGVAALLLSAHIAAGDILRDLEEGATKQSGSEWSTSFGYGVVNADAAAVIAGIIAPTPDIKMANNGDNSSIFLPSRAFSQDRKWMIAAQKDEAVDLKKLKGAAENGQANAETWMAFYEHAIGNNEASAHWAWLASQAGQPVAESFLGTLFNRGWGLPLDPRAAHAWWLRSAQAGIPNALYNLGITTAVGRGAVSNTGFGYALMQAAAIRGLDFPPMMQNMARIRSHLTPQQYHLAVRLAQGFAADPNTIPTPWSNIKK